MQNYARYGSYYAELLSSVEGKHPGLKDQLFKTIIYLWITFWTTFICKLWKKSTRDLFYSLVKSKTGGIFKESYF